MAQQNLFGDAAQAARDEAEAALYRELRRIGRDRCTGWVTVYLETVVVYGPNVSARCWLNGKFASVLNRADVETAARDLWDQVEPVSGR